MPDRQSRRDLYLDFLGAPPTDPRRSRPGGLYGAVTFGEPPRKVAVLLLDTRWGRERHCIPSVAGLKYLKMGSVIGCLTRWAAAGLNLPALLPSCTRKRVLDEEQWQWLEGYVSQSDAQVHVVVSSIQVLTTNPAVESWGHFPEERRRLLRTLGGLPGLVLLSGDVHHAEISDATAMDESDRGRLLEITSSGLTHSCEGSKLYGWACRPILEKFHRHRYRGNRSSNDLGDKDGPFYFTGRNYGTLNIGWDFINGKNNDSSHHRIDQGSRNSGRGTMSVNIHSIDGDTLLTTGELNLSHSIELTEDELRQIADCIDGHLLPLMRTAALVFLVQAALIIWLRLRRRCQARAVANKR